MNVEYLKFSTKGNTRRKVLQERVVMQEHNLLCYSRTFGMDTPKLSMESEWDDAREKLQLFTQILREQPDENGIAYYYCTIDEWIQLNDLCFICIKVVSAEHEDIQVPTMYFKTPLPLYSEWIDRYKKDIEARKEEDVPIVLKLQVKKGTVYEIKWVDEWD